MRDHRAARAATARPKKVVQTPPRELWLQTDVADVLSRHAHPEWRWTHFPAGERRDVRTGARLKRMGLQKGWPDFQLVSPLGQLHCLELKRIGEKLSTEQDEFRLWCIKHGVPHVVADRLDEVLGAFAVWDCLSIKIASGAP
jgi:hypothetical protein